MQVIDQPRTTPIAEIIRAYRSLKNISAYQFAIDVGISQTALYNIESGRTRDPHARTIGRVAKAMGRSIESLLDEIDVLDERNVANIEDTSQLKEVEISGWLKDKPSLWSQIISVRAALRVVPTVGDIRKSFVRDRVGAERYLIALFRSMHVTWYDSLYGGNNRRAITNARDELDEAADFDKIPKNAFEAGGAIYWATGGVKGEQAEKTVEWALNSLGNEPTKASDLLRAISSDCNDIVESGTNARRIASVKLWPLGQPPWLVREFRSFERFVRSLGPSWSFWTTLYESRLNGNFSFNLKLDMAERLDTFIIEQREHWWDQRPEDINEELLALVETLKTGNAKPGTDDEVAVFTQRPAPHQFGERDGRIVAKPTSSQLNRTPLADDIWRETVDKAKATLERLRRTQAPPHVVRTVERLIAALGNSVDQVAPGILLMRSRSVDADLATFETEQARNELMTDAQSLIRDLSASLEDLRALFPEIMEIEAARIAQRVTDGTAALAFESAKAVIAEARVSDVVDRSAVEALEAVLVDIDETDEIIKESTNDLVVAEAVQAKARLISLHLLDVRNFSASALKSFKEKSHQAARGTARVISRGVADVSQRAYKGTLDGIEESAKAGTKVALAALVTSLVSPLAGLAMVVGSFVSLSKKAKEVSEEIAEQQRDEETRV